MKETLLEDKCQAVAMIFKFGFGGPEPCDWEHGMMAEIKKMLGYHERSDIKGILMDIVYCKRHGLQYSPKLKYHENSERYSLKEVDGQEA